MSGNFPDSDYYTHLFSDPSSDAPRIFTLRGVWRLLFRAHCDRPSFLVGSEGCGRSARALPQGLPRSLTLRAAHTAGPPALTGSPGTSEPTGGSRGSSPRGGQAELAIAALTEAERAEG